MPEHLTPAEKARLSEIDARLDELARDADPLKRERKAILSRARQRKFLAKTQTRR